MVYLIKSFYCAQQFVKKFPYDFVIICTGLSVCCYIALLYVLYYVGFGESLSN